METCIENNNLLNEHERIKHRPDNNSMYGNQVIKNKPTD